MGMLDEAIREHLELKRRRGADPGEVAREQREALEPNLAADPAGAESASEPSDDGAFEEPRDAVSHFAAEDPQEASLETEEHERPPVPELSTVAQETAEIDMERVLEEEHDLGEGPTPAGAAFGAQAPDVAQWDSSQEYDGDREHGHGDVPGQERLSFE
jgi:hypothetical protein